MARTIPAIGALAPVPDAARPVTTAARIAALEVELEYFRDVFGADRSRHSITWQEVKAELDSMRSAEPVDPPRKSGLKFGTVKGYRIALRAFFYSMNGSDGRNPVKAAKLPKAPKASTKGRPMAQVRAILAAIKAK